MADVLKQAAHVPSLGWGSWVVSFVVRILGLEGETKDAVVPSLALSSTEFYGSTLLSHGSSIFFQNHTICQFALVSVLGSSVLVDIVTLDGLPRTPRIYTVSEVVVVGKLGSFVS